MKKATYRANKLLKKTIIRSSDFSKKKISAPTKKFLIKSGKIQKIKKGVYRSINNSEAGQYTSYIEATQLIPGGVVCLLSALSFYEIGTQMPSDISIAIPRNAYIPNKTLDHIKILRYAENSYKAGIERHQKFGVEIPVYNVNKTIADCFKYRNKIGMDVVLEALNDAYDQDLIKIDDLLMYAKINRVYKVIRPYMENLLL